MVETMVNLPAFLTMSQKVSQAELQKLLDVSAT
jgi:hypothetical protein